MENRLILEEIKRFRLLTNYNSNFTLTENESKVEMNNVEMNEAELGEQTTKQFLSLFRGTLSKADDVAFSNSGKNYADWIKTNVHHVLLHLARQGQIMRAGVKICLLVGDHQIAQELRAKLVMAQIHVVRVQHLLIANNRVFVHEFLNQIFQMRLLVKS